jgi:hypothetical protein
MPKNSIFIQLLKQYTNIDHNFIDTFFTKFKIGGEFNYDIEDIKAAKYLDIKLNTLRRRLMNEFSKTKIYFEKVDYIKIKSDKSNAGLSYMLNYQCFERLAMSGDSEQSEVVRMYFVKLREFITENHHLIYQAMTNKKDLSKYSKMESIYFFAVDETKFNFKIGRTNDIVLRLNNYNVGRIKEVDLKYFALVKNNKIIEQCLKLKLKKNQVIKNKEIYKIDPIELKKVINNCYCKYVSQKKHEELYEEISNLLGIYSYTKNKKNIKPFIIIGNNI